MDSRVGNFTRSARAGACFVGLLALLSACGGGSEPVMISLEASSSSGDDIEVTYDTDDGEVTEVVASPWSLEMERSGSFSANLEVRNTGLDGDVRCEVTSDAFPPIGTGGEAAAICRSQVSRSGGSTTVSSGTDFELFLRNASGEAVVLPEGFAEPQDAEVGSVTHLDGQVLLGGHKAVYLLDTATGVVETIEGSRDFGNPIEAAMADDGTVYAVDIFKDLLQAIQPGTSEVVDVAEFPDESPNGVWVVDGQLLVLLSGPDALLALDSDGSEQWRYEFPEAVSKAQIESMGDGTMLVASGEIPLVGLDVATGEQVFEIPVRDRVEDVQRRDDMVLIAFSNDDFGATLVVPIDELTAQNPSSTEVPGLVVVFDPSGVAYAADGDEISRLEPTTFEVDRSIETGGPSLLAAGDGVLYVYEKARAGSDDVEITALPTALFD